MLDFYTYGTFNGQRVSIMLEETALEYQVHKVDIMKGEQNEADFLAVNPSGRIPTIIDNDFEQPLIVTQSAAILLYLAEKTGLFLPKETIARAKVIEWLFFHATDITPSMFDSYYLTQRCETKELAAAKLLDKRIFGLYKNFDAQLAKHEFIAGDQYSIADIAIFPAIKADNDAFFKEYANINRWFKQLAARPSIQMGMSIPE